MENRDPFTGKIPFYMTYPMQNLYVTEMEYEKDMERMKELYPKEVSILQTMVEKRCDELEYEGSRMYDENPDRFMLEEESLKIYDAFSMEHSVENEVNQEITLAEKPHYFTELPAELEIQCWKRCREPWLCSLIKILFHNEIYRRRCRYRRCKRWW